MKITKEQKQSILKLQATLVSLQKGESISFNVTQYEKLGLVKVHGRTDDNRTKYILTEKAKLYLNVVI